MGTRGPPFLPHPDQGWGLQFPWWAQLGTRNQEEPAGEREGRLTVGWSQWVETL